MNTESEVFSTHQEDAIELLLRLASNNDTLSIVGYKKEEEHARLSALTPMQAFKELKPLLFKVSVGGKSFQGPIFSWGIVNDVYMWEWAGTFTKNRRVQILWFEEDDPVVFLYSGTGRPSTFLSEIVEGLSLGETLYPPRDGWSLWLNHMEDDSADMV